MVIKINYTSSDVYVSTSVSPVYVVVNYGGASGGGVWGEITGTLSDQTDLQTALDGKFDDPTGTTAQYLRGDGSLATFPTLTGYVPYTGATTNVNLGEFEVKAGQVTLDTSPTGTAVVGTTKWNDTVGLSETTLKGGNVVLRNGVDLVARVVNKVSPNTTLTKASYQAVRISGAQGQRLAVALAQANNDNNSADTIGLVTETIATNQEGFIVTVGQLEGINTTGSLQGETWSDGNVLYLSPTTAGKITNVKPVAPQHLVIIGYVEYAHAVNGKIYVKTNNGFELGELHDVDTTGATSGQVLKYNGTIWQPSGDVGITSLNGLNATTQTFATGTSGTDFAISSATSTHTFNLPTASATNRGALSSSDWSTFNGKQDALSLTTTGTSGAATLVGNTLNIPQYGGGGMSIGGTVTSGTIGSVLFVGASSVLSQDNANFYWDNTNKRLGIGTSTPANELVISKNQSLPTVLTVSNTTSNVFSYVNINATSDSSSGTSTFGKYSSTTAANKIINAKDAYFYNSTAGDISILNDFSTGKIKFSSGASSTAQMTLTNSGRLLLGTTTESTYIFDVSGATRLLGNTTFGTLGSGTGMYWDNTNNRLGIGITTPLIALDISGGARIGGIAITGNPSVPAGTGPALTEGYYSAGGYAFFQGYNYTSLAYIPVQVDGSFIYLNGNSSGNVGIGTTTNVASAQLHISSTTKGFLPPRMTTTQRNAIATPAAGLIVYDTTDNKHYGYNGTTWNAFF